MTLRSLATKLDGMPWNEVEGFVKKFNAATNNYALKDGSVIRKEVNHEMQLVAKYVNDGIHFNGVKE